MKIVQSFPVSARTDGVNEQLVHALQVLLKRKSRSSRRREARAVGMLQKARQIGLASRVPTGGTVAMYVFEERTGEGRIRGSRENGFTGFSRPLLSHPDEGKRGRVLCGRSSAVPSQWPIPSATGRRRRTIRSCPMSSLDDELDLRFLGLTLPAVEHLKGEYERVPLHPPTPAGVCCDLPWTIIRIQGRSTLASYWGDLAGLYRSFGFAEGAKLPGRPDHVAFEMGFMAFLIGQENVCSPGWPRSIPRVPSSSPGVTLPSEASSAIIWQAGSAGLPLVSGRTPGAATSSPWAGSWPPGCPWNAFVSTRARPR